MHYGLYGSWPHPPKRYAGRVPGIYVQYSTWAKMGRTRRAGRRRSIMVLYIARVGSWNTCFEPHHHVPYHTKPPTYRPAKGRGEGGGRDNDS